MFPKSNHSPTCSCAL